MATANPEKGELDITIGGQSYVLASSFNGLMEVQSLFAVDGVRPSIGSILKRAKDGDLEVLRALFWSTLRRHHPQIDLQKAGDLIDDVGGPSKLDALLDKVSKAGEPDTRDVDAVGGGAKNPRKPARKRATGIGARLN